MTGQLGLPGLEPASTADHGPAADERPAVPDAAERDRIADDLATTLFVEAGAGAGKTSSLVRRIVNLIVVEIGRAHV